MPYYRDMTWCVNKSCTKECDRRLTPYVEAICKDEGWWYAVAEFNARNQIYQSAKPDFNPDVEYMKDPLSRDIPSVDNSLFILARKLILESK